jgi:hypothetical protein
VRVFHLDRIDEVDAEIAVHRFVAQDVLGRSLEPVILFCRPIARFAEADVEEQSTMMGEHDQALQGCWSFSMVPVLNAGSVSTFDEGTELILSRIDDLVIGIEDFAPFRPRLSTMY